MARHYADENWQVPAYIQGKPRLYNTHSIEERSATTGALTNIDWMSRAGIVPRATPPEGFAPRVVARAPERGRRARRSAQQGYSVEPSTRARVIAALVLVGILVTVILAVRGW